MTQQYATDGKLGALVSRVDSSDNTVNPLYSNGAFPLGTEIAVANRGKWVYCKLPAISQIGSACQIDPTTWIAILTTTAAAKIGYPIGFAPAIANVGDFGWLQTSGDVDNMYVGANCAANAALNTTATAGMLDDDGTAGAGVVTSPVLTAARGGTNGVAAGFASGSTLTALHA